MKLRLPNEKNIERTGVDHSLYSHHHCCVCGKRMTARAKGDWLLIAREDTGECEWAIQHPSEGFVEQEHNSIWVAPIGSDCLRRHPELKPYLIFNTDARIDALTQERDTQGDCWLIHFEDEGMPPEIFTGEGAEAAAKQRIEMLAPSWNVALFRSLK